MIREILKSRDPKAIATYMKDNGLILKDGKIVPKSDSKKAELKQMEAFYDSRQQARKILLNSLKH